MTELDANRVQLRLCERADLAAITDIYGHEVRFGRASFETDSPSVAEMIARWESIREAGLPYLVAKSRGQVLGYAYAGRFRPRHAYRFTVENSVYLTEAARGLGIAGRLLDRLIAECQDLGLRQMIAVIGDSENHASIALHRSRGFREVGVQYAVGFKHGRWIDVVLMQLALGEGRDSLPE